MLGALIFHFTLELGNFYCGTTVPTVTTLPSVMTVPPAFTDYYCPLNPACMFLVRRLGSRSVLKEAFSRRRIERSCKEKEAQECLKRLRLFWVIFICVCIFFHFAF